MTYTTLVDRSIIAKEDSDIIRFRSIPVRMRRNLHVKPNSVTITNSEYMMGRNKHSNKLWGRWENRGLSSIRRTSTGKIAFLYRDAKNRPFGGMFAAEEMGLMFRSFPEVAQAVSDLGIEKNTDVYPALSAFADGEAEVNFSAISRAIGNAYGVPGLRPVKGRRLTALHNDDPREFISKITRMPYRKDVARAIQKIDAAASGELRWVCSIDPSWVADFIDNQDWGVLRGNLAWVGSVSRAFKEELISRDVYRRMLFEDGRRGTILHAEDAFRMARQHLTAREARRLFKENSVERAHQLLVDITNSKRDKALLAPIEYDAKFRALDGAQVGKYTIALAKTASEVKGWGQIQNHCIGSYAADSYGGRYIHAAVMEGDKIAANFQLVKELFPYSTETQRNAGVVADKKYIYRMTQIYGYGNSIFSDAPDIHDYLVEHSYIIKSVIRVGGIPVQWGGQENALNRNVNIDARAVADLPF